MRLVLKGNRYQFTFGKTYWAVSYLYNLHRFLVLNFLKIGLVNRALSLKVIVKTENNAIFVEVRLPIL